MKMFTTFILFVLIVTFHVQYINGQYLYTDGPLGLACQAANLISGYSYCAATYANPSPTCVSPDQQLLGMVCDGGLPCCVFTGSLLYTYGPAGLACRYLSLPMQLQYQSTQCQTSPCVSPAVTASTCDGEQYCCGIPRNTG